MKVRDRARRCALGALASLCAVLLSTTAGQGFAQELSYDGNRWVEIEVSVFTQPLVERPDREIADPEQTRPSYPRQLRPLDSRSLVFSVDFPSAAPAPSPPGVNVSGRLPAALPPPLYGPAPAVRERGFRVLDLARDPFVALEGQAQQFGELNRRLRSGDHRLLWHAAWRLPALPISETSAVFVRGGDRHGEHNELEGSVTVSAIPGGVDVNVNLWLNRFSRFSAFAEPAVTWQLPDQPFPPLEDAGDAFLAPEVVRLRVSEVAPLQQIRSITSERLHYFDHPAFGVLVQVRPYQLPEPVSRFAPE